jgi:hypothetical protein
MVKKLLITSNLLFSTLSFILIVYFILYKHLYRKEFVLSLKRLNHKFIYHILTKKFNKYINNDELIDSINNNTKNDNIEIYYRILNDNKIPIYVYKNENNENIALMELQKGDKINLFKYLVIKQDNNDIILSKDNFTKKNKNHVKIINNKIYINILSDIEFIKMNGFINNFGRMIENKFSLSDIVSNKNTLLGTLFMIMVNTFTLIVMACTVHKCSDCLWSNLIIISVLIGSYVTIFDLYNYENNYKDILHYISALSLFILLPISSYKLYDDKIIKKISLSIITLSLLFILFLKHENPNYHQAHLEKTGKSTVPCLYIDGIPLFESLDINQWLEKNKNKIQGQ